MSTLLDHPLLQDKPTNLPGIRPDGHELKPLPQVVLDRRTTTHFLPDPLPANYLQAILQLGIQSPSSFNLQPWRFIVVQSPENRRLLQKSLLHASPTQAHLAEAPVVIIALGLKMETQNHAEDIFREAARRGAGNRETVVTDTHHALDFLDSISLPLWINRHVMIAVTTMMLAAESYGFDTALLEDFHVPTLKQDFTIPDDAEVVTLLALGRLRQPDKPHSGRFPIEHLVSAERYGHPWPRSS